MSAFIVFVLSSPVSQQGTRIACAGRYLRLVLGGFLFNHGWGDFEFEARDLAIPASAL